MTTQLPTNLAPAPAPAPERPVVNQRDLARLTPYLGSPDTAPALASYLRWLLESARAVTPRRVPPDVVTMRSRVRVRSMFGGDSEVFVLSYPGDGEEDAGRLSVLSPLGAALLGAVEGSTVRVPGPRPRSFVVEAVEYQPERAGEYTQ